jgi:glyoxylase-like metal-dependent hydrolase (beta-lactamase superfamily II)
MASDTASRPQIFTLPVGMLEANCYLVWNALTLDLLLIDPGDEPARIVQAVTDRGLRPRAILLTHAHVDHIRAVPDLARRWSIPAWVAPADRPMYHSPLNALPPWVSAASNLPEPQDVPAELSGLAFRALPTPGHSPGGVCYYFPEAGIVFTGDTLFQSGIGRTDFPGGDSATLLAAIRQQLLTLPPATVIYPGHGAPSTIAEESANNPYL